MSAASMLATHCQTCHFWMRIQHVTTLIIRTHRSKTSHGGHHLVNEWLQCFKTIAPWDAARPGIAAIDLCVKRVFMAEIARARQKARISLFLDLSTFYETVSHSHLRANAIEVGFSLVVLNGAIQVYRGGRILQGDTQSSPPAYAQRGILAGCPWLRH